MARIIFQFNGLFGQDSYEYLKIERGIYPYFFNGAKIPYSVFPIGYGLIGALFSFLFMDDILVMQCISVFACFISCVYLRKIISTVYQSEYNVDLFLILFFILSPYVIRFSILVMSDMLCISIFLIFLYHSFCFLKTNSRKNFILLAIATSGCIYIRYASVVALAIPLSIILIHLIKTKKYIYILGGISIFLILSLPEMILRQRFIFWNFGEANTGFAYFYVPQQWSFGNFLKKDFFNGDGFQHYNYPNILFVFQNLVHPAFIFIGILFLCFTKKVTLLKTEVKIILAIILLYAMFAAGYAYQSNRYLLFTFPLILIFYYPAFVQIYQWCKIPKWLKIAGIICCGCIQLFLFIYSMQAVYQMNKSEKEIAETIQEKYVGKNIYTFSIDGALNTYNVDYTFFDIYRNSFNEIEPNALFLYNDAAFTKQFEGLNPVINLQFIQENYYLVELENFKDGWKLYEIK